MAEGTENSGGIDDSAAIGILATFARDLQQLLRVIDTDPPGLNLDANSPDEALEERKLAIQNCIQSLVHACACRNANCLPSCRNMKRVVVHTKVCRRKNTGGCPICMQLVGLCCYHAKFCEDAECSVPFCILIKQKLAQQQNTQRQQASAGVQ